MASHSNSSELFSSLVVNFFPNDYVCSQIIAETIEVLTFLFIQIDQVIKPQ